MRVSNHAGRVSAVLFVAATATWEPLSARPALAQEPPAAPTPGPAPEIRSIQFSGLKRTPERVALEISRIRVGDAADPVELGQATARLLGSGRFASAVYRLSEAADGVHLLWEVVERPLVTAIRFEGNHAYGESKLKGYVSQKKDSLVDWIAVREGRDSILAMYREAGYPDATVEYDAKRLEESGELVYTIVEGKRVRIRKIRFEGNTAFPDRRLKKVLETKTYLWIIRSGAFDKDVAEGDVARLQNFYRDEGFLDAKASYRTELSADGAKMTVTFSIEEGTRYAIESIGFRGYTVFSSDELYAMIASRVNETVKRPKVENDAKAIRGRYGESGYIYVTVRVVRVFSETPGLVRITFEIDEGEQFRVGHVRVRGNTRTKDKVVRRALSLFPPADLWDLTEAKEAERRLVDTRMFSSARIYPTGSQPGVRDAVIDVVESEKAGDFLVGVGVTSDSGVVGNIVLELKNFDLFDWPRSAAEFFKFRSFVGAGQTLRLELQPGTEVTRARIDFVEPYLFDKPIRYDHSIFLFERERDGYTEQRVGTTVSFGKRFEHGLLRFWSSELSFKLEDVDVKDVDLFAARDIKDVKGSSTLTSVKGTLVRDRTDNRFLPTTGDRFRVAYEQYGALGGDYAFGELTSGYSRFFTLHTDLRERKHVLEMRAEAGSILGEAPVFERFYAGGNGSIRGFDYRGIGPREGLDNNNVGGDYLILLGTEYSFPMIGENLRGLLFLDSGTAGGGRFRAGLGVGIRFTLDILGPVPFEFDLAAPVSSDDEDDTQVFSFMVGKIF